MPKFRRLTNNEIWTFIEVLKNYLIIWNIKLKEYSNKPMRDKYAMMLIEFEKKNLKINEKSNPGHARIFPPLRAARHRIARASLYNSLQNASDSILFYQQRVNSLTLATLLARNSIWQSERSQQGSKAASCRAPFKEAFISEFTSKLKDLLKE